MLMRVLPSVTTSQVRQLLLDHAIQRVGPVTDSLQDYISGTIGKAAPPLMATNNSRPLVESERELRAKDHKN